MSMKRRAGLTVLVLAMSLVSAAPAFAAASGNPDLPRCLAPCKHY
jgi:hypothetical protein